MADAEISKGVWWDSKAEKVVQSAPTEGIQIIAPGVHVTPALEREVQRYRDVEKPGDEIETAADDTAVETGSNAGTRKANVEKPGDEIETAADDTAVETGSNAGTRKAK